MAPFSWQERCLSETVGWLLLFLSVTSLPSGVHASLNNDVIRQLTKITEANSTCSLRRVNVTIPTYGDMYCEPVWDNLMCWPHYVKAGENATQPCPDYIDGFNSLETATRLCTEQGTWEKHPSDKINSSWTDFTNCLKKPKSSVPAIIEEHMPIVIQISTIGYSISLGTLIIATSIMTFFRKLHCQRNTIHINLFISFMVRAIISLLRNTLLVRHLALPSDVKYDDAGSLVFIQEGTHWECKLLNILWQYSLNANYMWIFVEGLYLHTLIFFAIFSQSTKFFKLYIIIGWVFPLIFIIFWVTARIFKNNTLCWNTHDKGFYWILNAPIVSSISVNFFFFLNIIRVLFTKIRDCNTRDPRRYRKLAKSTLVLIPLFGVYYIFFIALSMHQEPKTAVIHMYMEMTLNSFQGTVVALLFCFLNGEVRSEIKKKWHRHWLRRQSIVSGRTSRTFSTTSFYTGKERHSLSQGIPLWDVTSKEAAALSSPNSPTNNNNNGRVFHKVSSMPKLSQCSISNMKPIPRVLSSSKVTFNSTQNTTEVTAGVSSKIQRENSQQLEHEQVSNEDLQVSNLDDFSSLLPDSQKGTNTESCKTMDLTNLSTKKCFQAGDETKGFTFKGYNEDGTIVLNKESNFNGLPPLLDEEASVVTA